MLTWQEEQISVSPGKGGKLQEMISSKEKNERTFWEADDKNTAWLLTVRDRIYISYAGYECVANDPTLDKRRETKIFAAIEPIVFVNLYILVTYRYYVPAALVLPLDNFSGSL